MTPSAALPEEFARAWVEAIRTSLLQAADALGDLDRRAGDGDFGTNVRTAMTHAGRFLEEAQAEQAPTYRSWLRAMSMGWLGVGGTSGPLLGMFFRDVSKAAGGEGAPSIPQLADALAAGQATIQRYGEAEVGDKTMIDALAPAISALREADPAAPAEALAAAEDAAVRAAQETARSTARRGRASYVGDASVGVMDPGAAAMALIIGAARAALAGEEQARAGWIG